MSPIVILNPPLFSLLQFWLASELLPLTALEPPHVSADAVCCFGFFLQVACSTFHDDGTGPWTPDQDTGCQYGIHYH